MPGAAGKGGAAAGLSVAPGRRESSVGGEEEGPGVPQLSLPQ